MSDIPFVLVMEDDLFFSVRIETGLRKAGYAAQVVTQGDEAVHAAQARPPDLVIISFSGKRFDAADITRRLKALPDPAPVLGFVSHVWMPQVRPNAMAAGCDMLVANSALTMRLPQIVEKILSKHDLHDDDAPHTPGRGGRSGSGKLTRAPQQSGCVANRRSSSTSSISSSGCCLLMARWAA